jgi:hypothetical protein
MHPLCFVIPFWSTLERAQKRIHSIVYPGNNYEDFLVESGLLILLLFKKCEENSNFKTEQHRNSFIIANSFNANSLGLWIIRSYIVVLIF